MVYINHEYHFIVIENPKSGSTTLLDVLGRSLGITIPRKTRLRVIHMTVNEAKLEYSQYWDIYLKISTYRDPIQRFISSSFMSATVAHYDISYIEHGTPLDLSKLETFYLKNKSDYCYCRPQSDYTDNMDYLIHLDNFQEDYNILCTKLGIPTVSVSVLNKNPKLKLYKLGQMKSLYDRIYS
jgi:hypothetical protein